MHGKPMRTNQRIIAWEWLLFTVVVAGTVLFLALTITPNTGGRVISVNLRPFIRQKPVIACIVQICPNFQNMLWLAIINLVGNVAAFVPIGYGLTATFRRFNAVRFFPVAVVGTGFLFSLGIELAQLNLPSRITDIDDIILNTLGTIIGLAWWYVQAHIAARKDISLE